MDVECQNSQCDNLIAVLVHNYVNQVGEGEATETPSLTELIPLVGLGCAGGWGCRQVGVGADWEGWAAAL